jgi:hypothetical protein
MVFSKEQANRSMIKWETSTMEKRYFTINGVVQLNIHIQKEKIM